MGFSPLQVEHGELLVKSKETGKFEAAAGSIGSIFGDVWGGIKSGIVICLPRGKHSKRRPTYRQVY